MTTEIPRWRRFALGVTMFLTTGSNGFLQPFVSLYLAAAGLSKSRLGLALAIGTGLGIVIQPILGRLSDRYDARRPFMIVAGIVGALAYVSYTRASGFWALTLLTALGVNAFQYLNAVGGVLVGRLLRAQAAHGDTRGGAATYVRYRVWGSVGYIVVGMIAGKAVTSHLGPHAVLDRTLLDPVFTYGPILFLLIAVAAVFVPDGRVGPLPARDLTPQPPLPARNERPGEGVGGVRSLEGMSNLDWFLIAYFLYQFALYGASTYLPLFMRQLGGTPLWVTAMYAAGVVSELTVMSLIGPWTDRYGRRPALALAFLLMPIRLLLYIPATGPLWVLLVQMLHGLNFGIIGTIAVVVVNDHANESNRGMLQARLAAAAGIGNALGPLAGGLLSDRFGIGLMFAWMSIFGFAAAWVMWTKVRESHPSPETPRGLLRRLA